MALRMKGFAYFLIFLLVEGLVDDAVALTLVSPSVSLVDDDDNEYLASRKRPEEKASRFDKEPAFVGLKPQTADFTLDQRNGPSEWNLTTPFTPPPLYLFMSLQI
jgi:hypothetical protein